MKKFLILISALSLFISIMSAGFTASAEVSPLVWDFSDNDGGWVKSVAGSPTTNTYEQENHRITIGLSAGWGTSGIDKAMDPTFDGSKYDRIKLTIGKFPAGDLDGYIAFDADTIETPSEWVDFTVPATGAYEVVTIDMSDNDKWNNDADIDYIRIAFNNETNGLAAGNYIYIDKIEILPAAPASTTTSSTPGSTTLPNTSTTPAATTTTKPPVENIVFDFSKGDHGFRGAGNPDAATVMYSSSEKAMQGNMIATWGSVVYEKLLSKPIRGTDYKTIAVTLKNPTNMENESRITFATVSDKTMVNLSDAEVRFKMAPNSEKTYFLQIGEVAIWNNSDDIDLIWVQTSINSMVPGQAIYLKKVVLFTEKTTASNYKGDYNDGSSPSTGHDSSLPLAAATVLTITSVAICIILLKKAKIMNKA